MKKDQPKAASVEQQCPVCGSLFNISSSTRKRKVHCPQCREVVEPIDPGGLNSAPAAPSPARENPAPPAAPEWLARCEMLQARIEALEQQVEALMVTPRAHTSLLPERLPDLRHGVREHPLPKPPLESRAPSAPPPPAEPRREIPHADIPPPIHSPRPMRDEPEIAESSGRELFARPAAFPTPEIGLFVTVGDGAARQVADSLSEILRRTGWKVRAATEDKALLPGFGGLTLTAAPSLPVQRVTSTLNALRQAGFSVAFQIDPDRGPTEAALIVRTGPERDGPAPASPEGAS
jgi:hypothetical protein